MMFIFALLISHFLPFFACDQISDLLPDCADLGPVGSPSYEECRNLAVSVNLVVEAFKKETIGSSLLDPHGSLLDHPESEHFDFTQKACQKKQNCKDKNHNCYLPKVNYTELCEHVKVYKSPYADCMRKLRHKDITSESLESFINDYTQYGLSRKCEMLKENDVLQNAIFEECGEEAKESFKESLLPKTSPKYKECHTEATNIILVEDAFVRQPFGNPFRSSSGNVLDRPDSPSFEITLKACETIKTCQDSVVNCNLPKINYDVTCKKTKVFKSEYGECMRKIQKRAESADYEPSTDAMDSLFNDYTKYGLARKCLIFKEEKNKVENSILKECGEKAKESFKEALPSLKEFFDC